MDTDTDSVVASLNLEDRKKSTAKAKLKAASQQERVKLWE